MILSTAHLATLLGIIPSILAASYSLTDTFVGTSFLDGFNFEAIQDPTHGRVNYVDQATAQSLNLTYASGDTFILRADDTAVLDPNGPGRNSFRIRSNAKYTTHVAVFNLRHMPQGCGTWPALWETDEETWPNGGEIDILEGVNDQPPNAVTLHTTSGCTMSASRPQTGSATFLDCDVDANGNTGCGVTLQTSSYGPALNSGGGGWYVLERTNSFVKVWFWARNDASVPAEVANGSNTIDTSTWGTPSAFFPDDSCDIESHFDAHNIIINLTFCGDWAGNVYGSSGCPSTCVDFVNNHPEGLTGAFFDFQSVHVYT